MEIPLIATDFKIDSGPVDFSFQEGADRGPGELPKGIARGPSNPCGFQKMQGIARTPY